MPKANSRKHAMHHKKARAHGAVKAHARRPAAHKPSTSGAASPPEPEIIDEEFSPRSTERVVDDDLDETGIYGSGRDDRGEATG
jgi:hypothetical protein